MNRSKILAIALLFFSALSAPSFAAAEFFLKITGAVQGEFKGENRAGQIPIFGYSFHVDVPIDAATGQPTGKRQYQPVKITKSLDLASPQILHALTSSEVLTTVVIQAFNTTKDGKVSSAYTITLTNAHVVGLEQTGASDEKQTEQVTLTFQTVTVKVADLTTTDSFVPGT